MGKQFNDRDETPVIGSCSRYDLKKRGTCLIIAGLLVFAVIARAGEPDKRTTDAQKAPDSKAFKFDKVRSPLFELYDDAYYLISLPDVLLSAEAKKSIPTNGLPLILDMRGDNSLKRGKGDAFLWYDKILRETAPDAIIISPNLLFNDEGDPWACLCNQRHVLGCIEDAIHKYSVDKGRIYMFCQSMGGQVGIWFGFWYGRIFAGIASTSSETMDWTGANGLRYGEEKWIAAYPAPYAKETALNFISGEKDPRTDIMNRFVQLVAKRGFKVPFTVIKGAGSYLPNDEYRKLAQWLVQQKRDPATVLPTARARWEYILARQKERRVLYDAKGASFEGTKCSICERKPEELRNIGEQIAAWDKASTSKSTATNKVAPPDKSRKKETK